MQRSFPTLEVLASHTIIKAQQPQEEPQTLAIVTKVQPPQQVGKREPQSKDHVAQQVTLLENPKQPHEH